MNYSRLTLILVLYLHVTRQLSFWYHVRIRGQHQHPIECNGTLIPIETLQPIEFPLKRRDLEMITELRIVAKEMKYLSASECHFTSRVVFHTQTVWLNPVMVEEEEGGGGDLTTTFRCYIKEKQVWSRFPRSVRVSYQNEVGKMLVWIPPNENELCNIYNLFSITP